MSFGGHLRTLRGQACLSRAELARRAGVPLSTLRQWKNGRGFPDLAACPRLAEALGGAGGAARGGGERPGGGWARTRTEQPHRTATGKAP